MRKAAKVMWFEKAFLWLQQVEKVIVFPMVILSALTMDLEKMKEPNANHWLGKKFIKKNLKQKFCLLWKF